MALKRLKLDTGTPGATSTLVERGGRTRVEVAPGAPVSSLRRFRAIAHTHTHTSLKGRINASGIE